MSAQEKAGIKALDKHQQKPGARDGQLHCLCEWKTETTGQAAQKKSFRRHQIREVGKALKAAAQPFEGLVVLMTCDVDLGALPDAHVIGIRMSNGHGLRIGDVAQVEPVGAA